MNRIQDIQSFEELIFGVISDYIDGKELYPSDAVLQIDTKSMEVSIDSPLEFDGIENTSLQSLILIEEGKEDADCDAVNELANKYFFVR